jgi:hypothetical protein
MIGHVTFEVQLIDVGQGVSGEHIAGHPPAVGDEIVIQPLHGSTSNADGTSPQLRATVVAVDHARRLIQAQTSAASLSRH